MTKISLISLACVAVLAFCPTALVGQSYNFDVSGGGISLDGIFTIDPTQNSLNAPYTSYTITSFSGIYSNSNDGVSGMIGLLSLPSAGNASLGNPAVIEINGGDDFFWDNQYYPSGSPDASPALFEWETDPSCCSAVGLIVTPSDLSTGPSVGTNISNLGNPAPFYYVFLSGLPGGDYATYDEAAGGYTRPDGYEFANSIPAADVTITAVPESGSKAMLALCAFALAGGVFFKAKRPGRYLSI